MKVELISCSAYNGSLFGGSVKEPESLFIAIARVSSNKPMEERGLNPEPLIKHCLVNGHWSVFEMVNICLYVETSLAVATQMLRHKSFSFQMFSQRYKERFNAEPVELRLAGASNRQGSLEEAFQDGEAEGLLKETVKKAFDAYRLLIERGVALECARFMLPACTTTELFMNGSLRSYIHYLQQRLNKHSQKEHRMVAAEVKKIVEKIFPITFKILAELKYFS
jgi:thymidylate synthase (FAD)